MWYLLFKYVLIGPVVRLVYRPRVIGRELVPARGPVILAANHTAFTDSLLLCLVLRRRVTFVAKREYFDRPGIVGRLQRWFFTSVGQIPVDRRGGTNADGALRAAGRVLADGGVWAIYPEGTRTPGDAVYRGHTGVIRVSSSTGAQVFPVGIRRARMRAQIVIGRPLEATLDGGDPRPATDVLMGEIAVLAGRRTVPDYVARASR